MAISYNETTVTNFKWPSVLCHSPHHTVLCSGVSCRHQHLPWLHDLPGSLSLALCTPKLLPYASILFSLSALPPPTLIRNVSTSRIPTYHSRPMQASSFLLGVPPTPSPTTQPHTVRPCRSSSPLVSDLPRCDCLLALITL